MPEDRSSDASMRRRNALLATAAVALALLTHLLYPVLDHGPHRIFLETPVDRAMPLVPVLVIPYVSLIPLVVVAAVVFGAVDMRRLQSYAVALTIHQHYVADVAGGLVVAAVAVLGAEKLTAKTAGVTAGSAVTPE